MQSMEISQNMPTQLNIPKMRLHAELLMTDLHGGCVGIYSAFFLPFSRVQDRHWVNVFKLI